MMNAESGPVVDQTIALCQAIINDPSFGQLRRHIDAFMADDDAQTQYRELSERGAALQHKQQMGVPLENSDIQEFESRREAFLANPVAREFLSAQQAIHDIRDVVNRYVSRTFELGRLPQTEDFESCSCGSGGCGNH
jgi:cell fate (sporulation/competence/biofilm development) regulator YlbF (YheA/YmcA/DUF963 family)